MLEEDKNKGFKCINCQRWVPINVYMGTNNRNHCPYCLWSRHVDRSTPGDRLAGCDTGMKPIAIVLKRAGLNKWGNKVMGEIMIVHECVRCNKLSINRIAADDDEKEIMNVFERSFTLDDTTKKRLENSDIDIAKESDKEELNNQLFGKNI